MTKANGLTLPKVLGLLAVVVLLLTLPAAVLAQPVLPPVFAGTAKVDGIPASDGINVTAWINDRLAASVSVKNGTYAFAIPQPSGNPFNRGDTITFKIGNFDVQQTAVWAGDGEELNLTATSSAPTATTAPVATAAPVIIAGATGVPGRKGDRGDLGQVGGRGRDGAAGRQGDSGQPGDAGLSGATGVPGVQGKDGLGGPGPSGRQGEDGEDGRQGRPGTPGVAGDTAGGLFGMIALGVAIVALVAAGGAILKGRRY